VACIGNELLTSKYECVVKSYVSNLDTPKRLTNRKLYTKSCLSHPYKEFTFFMVFYTKKSHRRVLDAKWDRKFCVNKRICKSKIIVLIN